MSRKSRNIVGITLGIFIFIFLTIEFLLWFYASPLIQGSLQKAIDRFTDSLYNISFDKIRYNALTSSFYITDFKLIPDTSRRSDQNLYWIEFKRFDIKRINWIQLLAEKRISVKKISFVRPRVYLYYSANNKAKPDTIPVSYDVVKQDFLVKFFDYVNSIYIKRLQIIDGQFEFLKQLQHTFRSRQITLILNKFYIDRKSVMQKDLFTTDFEIIIGDYSVELGNLHRLFAKQLRIVSADSLIEFTDTWLQPQSFVDTANLFNVYVKKLQLYGADFKQIYLNKEVDLTKAIANEVKIKFYKFRKAKGKMQVHTPYDLYLIVKNFLKYIHIGQIQVQNASLSQFYHWDLVYPAVRVNGINVFLQDFYADSASAFDSTRFFFAKNVQINITDLYSRLKDSLHYISARQLYISTFSKRLEARDFNLLPIPKTNIPQFANLYNIRSKVFLVKGFDLMRFYYQKRLEISLLALNKASVNITNFAKKKNKSAKSRNKILSLLNNVYVDSLVINQAKYQYVRIDTNRLFKTSGQIAIVVNRLRWNPALNLQKSFDFKSIDFVFTDFIYQNTTAIHKVFFDSLHLQTTQNLLTIYGFRLTPIDSARKLLEQSGKMMEFDFLLPSLTIKGFDIKKYLLDNAFIFNYIRVSKPVIKITSYPELSYKQIKTQLRDYIRQKAAGEIVLAASQAIFDIYQSVPYVDSTIYSLMKAKVEAVDSLQNYANQVIFNIHIPNSQIKIIDTSAKNISRIKQIVMQIYNQLSDTSLKINQIDSMFFAGIAQISHIYMLSQRPVMNFEEIARSLAEFISKITADSVTLNSLQISFNQKYEDKHISLFNNVVNLRLYDFDFNADSIENCRKNLLCSKNVVFEVKNYKFRLDSTHTLRIRRLVTVVADSVVRLEGIDIQADSLRHKSNLYLSAVIPEIKLSGVDFWKVIDSSKLQIKRLYFSSGFVHLHNSSKQRSTSGRPLVLPVLIQQILIDNVNLDNFKIHYEQNGINLFTKIRLHLHNFVLDSVVQVDLKNLPFSDYQIWLVDSRVKIKNTDLQTKRIYINQDIDLGIRGLELQIKQNTATVESLYVDNFDLNAFLDGKKLDLSYLYLLKPQLVIISAGGKQTSGSRDLKNIDLYRTIQPFMTAINLDSLKVRSLALRLANQVVENIDLWIRSLQIDSNVRIDSPYLFYSQNISLEIRNYRRKLNRFYSVEFGRFGINLDKHLIYFDSLRYFPNYDPYEFMSLQVWRTTLIDLFVNRLAINQINWRSLFFAKSINANSIFINGLNLYAYLDKSLPHDFSNIKPHYIYLLAKAPIPIDIQTVILRNGNIVYEEKIPDNAVAGHIELNSVNAIITNINNNLHSRNPYINVRMSALLQGQGDLVVSGMFKLDTVNYPFKLYGTLGAMDLRRFNDFLIYAANLQIPSGRLRKAEFLMIGEDSIATGYLKATYTDLSVYILKPSEEFNPKPRKFLSFVADVIVRNENPRYGIFNKVGTIAYIHDRSFSDIKFWVKAILTGIKSVILFENRRQQRKITRIKRRKSLGTDQNLLKSETK